MSEAGPAPSARDARRAEALGAALPPLLVAARRVAATVAQGVHGRRRVGQGDSFWQFRPFLLGDAVARIDWRQSAKSDRIFVRETEWEAAQTVCLWTDSSASMRWRSRLAPVEKSERGALLLLALAALLLRGGERVRLMAPDSPLGAQMGAQSLSGRDALERLAQGVMQNLMQARAEAASTESLPPSSLPLPRHASVVLFGDFLDPLSAVQASLARLAAVPVNAYVMQVLDPAEPALPFHGRVRFTDLEEDGEALIPRVEGVREAYAERFTHHQDGLAALCRALGFRFSTHMTDQPPEQALLALYLALAPGPEASGSGALFRPFGGGTPGVARG
ncbi:MAG TPA: DUF58 domain-containing protein [Acetobacteraceae bacterium]|nr:DUF58 domain-containing protein [Acetobacteraceae bacterium]